MSSEDTTRDEDKIEGRQGAQTADPPSEDSGPMEIVAGALRRASETLGAKDQGVGRQGMEEYGLLGRMAYQASYGLSYGVVYPAVMLARLVPGENVLVHGLVDGAVAARDEAPKLGWFSRMATTSGEGSMPFAPPV